jgi:hypothetical protein
VPGLATSCSGACSLLRGALGPVALAGVPDPPATVAPLGVVYC